MQFDPENRLTQYGSAVANAYNGDGLRAKKTYNGGYGYNWFVYDGDEPVCEVDGSGNVAALHTFGVNGLVSRRCNGATGFYVFDPSGNGALLLDSSGNVAIASVADSFGNTVSTGGNVYSAFLGQGGQWGYYQDAEDGLTLLGHRFYDRSTGRFLTRDPIGYDGGINLYNYTANNPVNDTDPTGLAVYWCVRPVKVGPVQCPNSTPYDHWFLRVTDCKPLSSMGWGPNGVYSKPTDNTGGYSSGDIHCTRLPASPAQERCLCNQFKRAQGGGLVCGRQWNGPGHVKYLTDGVVCQDFVNGLLKSCGMPTDPNTLMWPFGIWH